MLDKFQLFIGWREGELQGNFGKDALFEEGTDKWQKNMNIAVLSQGLLSRIVVLKAEIREFCPFYPQKAFDSYRLFTQFIDSPRYQWLIGLFLLILGSLSDNYGDGYENVTKKVRLRCVKLHRVYFISFILSNLGEFVGSWILKDSINNQEKKKRVVVLVRFAS